MLARAIRQSQKRFLAGAQVLVSEPGKPRTLPGLHQDLNLQNHPRQVAHPTHLCPIHRGFIAMSGRRPGGLHPGPVPMSRREAGGTRRRRLVAPWFSSLKGRPAWDGLSV